MTLSERIAELRELMAKATPGPWPCEPTGDHKRITIGKGLVEGPNGYEVAEVYSDDCPGEVAEANADLIAAMRNHLPYLLDALSAPHDGGLREKLETIEGLSRPLPPNRPRKTFDLTLEVIHRHAQEALSPPARPAEGMTEAREALEEVMRPYGLYDVAVSRSERAMQDVFIALGDKIRAALSKLGEG